MFQDSPLLAQPKRQLHSQTPHTERVVRATEKGFDFLEVDAQKSHFTPPPQMEKVIHDDRIIAVTHGEKERESAESEELIEPSLTRPVGKVQGKNDRLIIIPDHPLLRNAILYRAARGLNHEFKEGDWAAAEMRRHPLKGNRSFYAGLIQYTTFGDDHFVPWWVTPACHNLGEEALDGVATEMLDEGLIREDLTVLDLITADSVSTEDMDGALFAEALPDDKLQLIVAIVDPTAWTTEGSKLDKAAKIRAFTSYLPGLDIPMLSRELSDDLCSPCANEVHPVLTCRITLSASSAIEDSIEFFATTIESKVKLVYGQVSDWLENTGDWQPEGEAIAKQVRLLAQIYQRRGEWRHNHALVLKDRPSCRFILGEKGEVLDVIAEPHRVANYTVEEAMIAADVCAVRILCNKLDFGIYNAHMGFNPASADALATLLKTHGLHVDAEEVLTLDGFCRLRREPDAQPAGFLDSRIRHFQSSAEISTEPSPCLGLGLGAYATWVSPIRKYDNMTNHRLLKAVIKDETATRPQDEIIVQMAEHHRLNQMAKHDVGDWLYARFLKDKVGTGTRFIAETADISYGGMRARLVDNDTIAFIPAPFLHTVRSELVYSQENGTVQIKGETVCRVTNVTDITIAEVRMETRNITARPVT